MDQIQREKIAAKPKKNKSSMETARSGRNASGHIITAPEMVAEDGSR